MKTLNPSFLNHVVRSWFQLSEVFFFMSSMFCDKILPKYISEVPSLLLSTRILVLLYGQETKCLMLRFNPLLFANLFAYGRRKNIEISCEGAHGKRN